MRHVIGIDPSLTGTAVVAIRDTGVVCRPEVFGSKATPDKSMRARIARAEQLAAKVADWVEGIDIVTIDCILIEGYSYGSPARAHGIGEYGGLLRSGLLRRFDCRIIEAPPASLKQFATGKGNANKLAVATSLVKRYGYDFGGCDDLYDAFGLAKLAACVVGWDEPANDGQRKAVATIQASFGIKE